VEEHGDVRKEYGPMDDIGMMGSIAVHVFVEKSNIFKSSK